MASDNLNVLGSLTDLSQISQILTRSHLLKCYIKSTLVLDMWKTQRFIPFYLKTKNTPLYLYLVYYPITSWQIDGETVETVTDFILGGSKITADGDCSHEIKRHLLLGRKAMTNLDRRLKSRDLTLPTKVHLVKATVFPVWKWELDYKESRAPKNWCFGTVRSSW